LSASDSTTSALGGGAASSPRGAMANAATTPESARHPIARLRPSVPVTAIDQLESLFIQKPAQSSKGVSVRKSRVPTTEQAVQTICRSAGMPKQKKPSVAPDEAIESIRRGAMDFIEEGELRRKLETGRKLRIKLGLDPTA